MAAIAASCTTRFRWWGSVMTSATSPGVIAASASTSTDVPWSSPTTSMNRRSAGVIVPLLPTTQRSARSATGVCFSFRTTRSIESSLR